MQEILSIAMAVITAITTVALESHNYEIGGGGGGGGGGQYYYLLPDVSMIRTSAEAVVKFTAVSPVASVMVKSSVSSTTWSAVMLMFSHLNGEAPEKVTDVVRDVKSKESNMEKVSYVAWLCTQTGGTKILNACILFH